MVCVVGLDGGGRILRGQLEAASQQVGLRQLDRGGLGLELGSESGLGFRLSGLIKVRVRVSGL